MKIEFDVLCKTCSGHGNYSDSDWDDVRVTCENCDGKGYKLTELGKEFLEFIKRHWKK